MSGEMYYRGPGAGGGGGGGGGGAYYGRESSGRGAFRAHAEQKKKAEELKVWLAAGGGAVVLVLVVVVWVLSGRGHLPSAYVEECRQSCLGADYLCGTICDKAMVGPFAGRRDACARGCGAFGEAACAAACASNDLGACLGAMRERAAGEFCAEEDRGEGGGGGDRSARKACEIGVGAVATTQWPCSVGVKSIGRILSEHKM
jgi:hypothetical protein